jgi:hypothetical protein
MTPLPSRLAVVGGIAAVLAGGPAAAQGLNGFLPDPGAAIVAVSHTLESYDEYWVGPTTVIDSLLGKVETGSVSLWIDVGLARDLALIAQLAYVDVASDGLLGQSASGLQDRGLLLRWRFLGAEAAGYRQALVAAAGLRDAAAGYEPDRAVALGDGSRDGLFRLVYQIQADHLAGAWLATEVGFDLREGDVPDGMSLNAELGAVLGGAAVSATVTRVWADGGPNLGDVGFAYPEVDEEWLRVGGKVYVGVSDRVGLAVSAFATPKGENTGKATGTSVGLVLRI